MSLIFFTLFPTILSSQTTTLTLAPGENLYRLTLKTGVPFEVLKRVNNIQDETRLTAGQKIEVPLYHRVIRGDTLFSLSRRLNIPLASLKNWNNLKEDSLNLGQRIYYLPKAPPIRSEAPVPIQRTETPKAGLMVTLKPVNAKPDPIKVPVLGFQFLPASGDFVSLTEGTIIFQDVIREFGKVMLIETPEGTILGYSGYDTSDMTLGNTVRSGQTLGGFTRKDAKLLVFAYKDGISQEILWSNP